MGVDVSVDSSYPSSEVELGSEVTLEFRLVSEFTGVSSASKEPGNNVCSSSFTASSRALRCGMRWGAEPGEDRTSEDSCK